MIRFENVWKTYQRGGHPVTALRDVSYEFSPGSFTFVLGPSGSGKSTLLQLVGALDKPSQGAIFVADRRLNGRTRRELDRYRRDEVGFIFQNFNLLSNLSCVDNVLVPFLPKGVSAEQRSAAVALLRRVGLADRLEHRPGQLSGGEQQRVAIARALMKQPSIILADEPTGELDTRNGEEIFTLLRELSRERHTTVIIVTHDHRYLAADDSVIRLEDGKLACTEVAT